MAVWASAQILDEDEFAALRKRHLDHEENEDVRAEWSAVLSLVPAH
jgi:hypothetical protein